MLVESCFNGSTGVIWYAETQCDIANKQMGIFVGVYEQIVNKLRNYPRNVISH